MAQIVQKQLVKIDRIQFRALPNPNVGIAIIISM